MKSRKKQVLYNGMIILFATVMVLCIILFAAYFLPAQMLPGYCGTIEIADVGIKVKMIEVPRRTDESELKHFLLDEWTQFVVDKKECAGKFYRSAGGVLLEGVPRGSWVIGDHVFQEFENLKKCKEGMEVVITQPDGSADKYYVAAHFEGRNTGNNLVYQDGTTVLKDNPGGLILYTCMDETAVPIYIVFLQPVQ